MHVLRVEHDVADFEAWKQMFDADPLGRDAGGVRRHTVFRESGNPNRVLIDLEFDDAGRADAFHERLRELWTRVDVMQNPTAQVAEIVEVAEY